MRELAAGALVMIGGLVLFVGLILGAIFIGGGMSWITAPFRGEVEKREQVEGDGGYRIAKYDQFFGLCKDYNTKVQEIELAEQTLEGDHKKEVVYAHATQRQAIAEEYNAMANQDYTAGQFRDADLPVELDPNGTEVVSCGG